MTLTITGARSELGALLAQRRVRSNLHINVAGQQANTLLHDGHAWKDFQRTALAGVRRAARADASMLVHASFAFVITEPARDPLRSLIYHAADRAVRDVFVDGEQVVAGGKVTTLDQAGAGGRLRAAQERMEAQTPE